MHHNARLEAFCDGVFAIALTLLIIDIRLPATVSVGTSPELWHALGRLLPSVFAFLLSFSIILITWVNHHGALKLVHRSTASFMYANGLLLLTVVFIPFPTSLLGQFVLSETASPAVVLYNAVLAVQSIAWIMIGRAALNNHLYNDEPAAAIARENMRRGYVAFAFYALLAIVAVWFPLTSAIITTVSWMFWLALGIRMKHH